VSTGIHIVNRGIGVSIVNATMQVVKATVPKRYTLGVAYPADKADISVAKDGHIDFASADVIEDAAWAYMKKSRNVGLWHSSDPRDDGRGEVVESYIWRGPDWNVGGQLVKAGDWMLGTVWDPQAWSLIEMGLVNGYSPQGGGRRRPADPDRIAQLRTA
jgi:hypothetical protein